jgi:hypothetical protein
LADFLPNWIFRGVFCKEKKKKRITKRKDPRAIEKGKN